MDHIVICMDIDPVEQQQNVDVQQIEFTIKDPFNRATLTSYSLDRDGDNSLIVPGYEASSFRPEAQMRIDLGFDFMQRFSKDSAEKVMFNVEVDQAAGATPSFFIAADESYVALPNLLTLGAFIGFWIVVFIILFRVTHPAKSKAKQAVST